VLAWRERIICLARTWYGKRNRATDNNITGLLSTIDRLLRFPARSDRDFNRQRMGKEAGGAVFYWEPFYFRIPGSKSGAARARWDQATAEASDTPRMVAVGTVKRLLDGAMPSDRRAAEADLQSARDVRQGGPSWWIINFSAGCGMASRADAEWDVPGICPRTATRENQRGSH